jgi:hypothetical protein
MGSEPQDTTRVNETILEKIAELLKNIHYGSLLIKVHDSKIVQVEVTEKSRFDNMWFMEKGGGI